MVKSRIIEWLLDHLDCDHILRNARKRGWVPVPKAYAEKAFPGQLASGWWPINGEQVTVTGFNDVNEQPILLQVVGAPCDYDDKH